MPRHRMLLLAAALCIAPPAWAADTSIPADWVEVAAGPMFTVKAPPGTHFNRVRTGDAFAGTISGPGFEMAVEFGYHRDGLTKPSGATGAAETQAVIDAKPGTIARADVPDAAHPHFIGLYVPNVETDAFGPLSLVIKTDVARNDDEAIVEAIYRSVKFGYKN